MNVICCVWCYKFTKTVENVSFKYAWNTDAEMYSNNRNVETDILEYMYVKWKTNVYIYVINTFQWIPWNTATYCTTCAKGRITECVVCTHFVGIC